MRIGFFTSTFSDRPIEEVLDFAKQSGFDAIEIDMNNHIGDPDRLAEVVESARKRGLFVASVALTGNQLNPDRAARQALRQRTGHVAAAASAAQVPILVIFPGRDAGASEDDNYADFAAHMNAILSDDRTGELNVVLENWPGPNNDYIGTTPAGLERLFSLVANPRFGFEFDPSHFIRIGVDPYRAYDLVRERVKIVHAKDTSIDKERLQAVGYHGEGWWQYRLPGGGVLEWGKFLRHLRASGYDGVLSVEHEDADFGWPGKDFEARYEGERQALAHLQRALAAM